MGKFINVRKQVEPVSTMFEPEIDALLAITEEAISRIQNFNLVRGSFIIDGQAYGEEPQLIVRGNLSGGIYRRQFFRTYVRTSDEMVEESINELLKWPDESCRYQRHFLERFFAIQGKVYPTTGIYQDGELMVLILNATNGRFLVGFKAQGTTLAVEDEVFTEYPKADEAILYAISECIGMLMREDMVLQRSLTELLLERESSALSADAMLRVVNLFNQMELPELKAWRAWHDEANGTGKLSLPFA